MTGGSVFYFQLPVVSFLDVNFPSIHEKGPILIVDDDTILKNTYEKWLRDSHGRVLACSSFSEARVAMEFEKPSLILMDVTIPGENTDDFLSVLPENVSVIIASGLSEETVRVKYGSYPQVVSILEKPFTKNQLREVIKKYFVLGMSRSMEKAA